MKKSYVFLADGFEEIEALTPVDVMRRAGMEVLTVSIMAGRKAVKGAHGVCIDADVQIDSVEIEDAEWLVLPGGMPGATNLAGCSKLTELLKAQQDAGGKIAAICASPGVVLGPLGLLDGREVTGYPGFEGGAPAGKWRGEAVCESGGVVTGRGPGAAMAFALAIVKSTLGSETSERIASEMLWHS